MMARRSESSAEQVWRERLGRFAGSGLSVQEFCDREDVSTASFYSWRRRLGSAGSETPLFVPVSVRPASDFPVRIVLPNGVVLEVPAGVEAAHVRMCLLALREGANGEAPEC